MLEDVLVGQGYRGNKNLKGIKDVSLIPSSFYEEYLREFIRCSKDPIYFANKYYSIISPGVGKHIIKTYPKQDDLIKTLVDNDRVIVLASRQVGKTTSYCIFALHTICFNEDKKILILANKGSIAIDFLSRIKLAYELLPTWIKPSIKEWNKGKIEFSNGCIIEGCTTAPDTARGKSADILIIDEFAFVPDNLAEELWASVYPIVSSAKGTKVIIVSTPNGTANLYYKIWQSAIYGNDPDGWVSFKFLWYEVPGRDEEWKKKQLASFNNDMTKWNQEFGCEFLGSSYTLIDIEKIKLYKQKFSTKKKDPKILKLNTSEIKVFYPPEKDHCYVIGGDICDGVGNDYTVFSVFDITDAFHIKQVAVFSDNKITTSKAAYVAAKLGLYYNNAPIFVESNGVGKSCIDFLHTIYEYENIASFGGKGIGIFSSNKIKVEACLNLKKYLELDEIDIEFNDDTVLTQLEYFEKRILNLGNVTYQAIRGFNDDHVIACMWAFYVLMQENIEFFFNCDYKKVGLDIYVNRVKQISLDYLKEQEKEQNRIELVYKKIEKFKTTTTVENVSMEQINSVNQDDLPNNIGFIS